jgi:hypothetical protein
MATAADSLDIYLDNCWSSELVLASVHRTLACPITMLACLAYVDASFRASGLTLQTQHRFSQRKRLVEYGRRRTLPYVPIKIALCTRVKVTVP